MVQLTDEEKRLLDGEQGPAAQKAMDLLVRYARALGAERLVPTRNVCGTVVANNPFLREFRDAYGGMDAVFSQFNLDSDQVVPIPSVSANSCQLIQSVDTVEWRELGLDSTLVQEQAITEEWAGKHGISMLATCTPYQVGMLPTRGEHCAWMESSAVIYINSVIGARSNVEGRESTGAAMIVGRVPYWGYHVPEHRLGTHLVEWTHEPQESFQWGLLGYYLGETLLEGVPVLPPLATVPTLEVLKHFGAAAATSGGIEMYHIVGVTSEAPTLDVALGHRPPAGRVAYSPVEARQAYEWLNVTGRDLHVDLVTIGCPHASLAQVRDVLRTLRGRKVSPSTSLWIFLPRALRAIADSQGWTRELHSAGAKLLSDTCPAIGRVVPRGARVAATDSAKQAHYLPATMGIQTWYGTTEDCVEAAVTGIWRPEHAEAALAE